MWIGYRKEIRKLKFRALTLRRSESLRRSDEGLTLEASASKSLYAGQFTLSTQLIKQNYLGHMSICYIYSFHNLKEGKHHWDDHNVIVSNEIHRDLV